MNDALRELFTTDVGILSLLVIVGVIAIGTAMKIWIGRQIDRDSGRG
jgi:hypothetical protein